LLGKLEKNTAKLYLQISSQAAFRTAHLPNETHASQSARYVQWERDIFGKDCTEFRPIVISSCEFDSFVALGADLPLPVINSAIPC